MHESGSVGQDAAAVQGMGEALQVRYPNAQQLARYDRELVTWHPGWGLLATSGPSRASAPAVTETALEVWQKHLADKVVPLSQSAQIGFDVSCPLPASLAWLWGLLELQTCQRVGLVGVPFDSILGQAWQAWAQTANVELDANAHQDAVVAAVRNHNELLALQAYVAAHAIDDHTLLVVCPPQLTLAVMTSLQGQYEVRARANNAYHSLLPGSVLPHQGYDVLCLRRSGNASAASDGTASLADANRIQDAWHVPHAVLSLVGLNPSNGDPFDVFARALRTLVPGEALHVHPSRWVADGSQLVVSATFAAGRGISGAYVPASRVLNLELAPYDPICAAVSVSAGLTAFGDSYSRARWLGESTLELEDPFAPIPQVVPAELSSDAGLALSVPAGQQGGAKSPGSAEQLALAPGVLLTVAHWGGLLMDLQHHRMAMVPTRLVHLAEQAAHRQLSPSGEALLREALVPFHGDMTAHRSTSPSPSDQAWWLSAAEVLPIDGLLRERLRQLDAKHAPHLAALLQQSPSTVKQAYQALLDAHAQRRCLYLSYGQCAVTPETGLRRALALGVVAAGDVPQRVLCVGDDDFVSLALAALGHEVVVLDLDPHVLAVIERTATLHGLSVETRALDLCNPLTEDAWAQSQLGTFDAFMADPVGNRACFELFVSRGAAFLKPGGRGHVAVFVAVRHLFARICGEMGLEIIAGRGNHNIYVDTYVQAHAYSSDWLTVAPKKRELEAVWQSLAYPPAELAEPDNLYRETGVVRLNLETSTFRDVDASTLNWMRLDALLDVAGTRAGVRWLHRDYALGVGQGVILGVWQEGFMRVAARHDDHEVHVTVYPRHNQLGEAMRELLVGALRLHARRAGMAIRHGVTRFCLRGNTPAAQKTSEVYGKPSP